MTLYRQAMRKTRITPPYLACIGSDQQKLIARDLMHSRAHHPALLETDEQHLVQACPVNARNRLAPGLAAIGAREKNRVQRHRVGMNVSRDEKLITERFESSQLEINRAGFIDGAAQSERLNILFGAVERRDNRLPRIFEHYVLRRGLVFRRPGPGGEQDGSRYGCEPSHPIPILTCPIRTSLLEE